MARSNLTEDQIRRPHNAADRLAHHTKLAEHDTALDALETTVNGTTDFKASVRFATTANVTLSSVGLTVTDGVTPVAGNRVLVKNQSTASQNGIYVVSATAWARATDFDASADVTSGAQVFVSEGTANGGNWFQLTTADPIVLATDDLTFTEMPSSAQLASTATGEGADLIGAYDSGGIYSGTTVRTQLQEVKVIADAAAPSASLALTTTPGGASYIGVFDTATKYTGTTVEACLAEVKTLADAAAVAATLALTTNGNGASLIGIEDASALVSGTTVEAAICTDIAKGNGLTAMAPVRRVRAVTTTDVASFTGVSTTLDGLTLVEGDRVLVSAQSTGAQEGIYVVGVVGGGTADWTRAADWAASAVIPNGTIIVVDAGTAGANTIYKLTNASTITVGTTDLTFERLYTSTELASTATGKGADLIGAYDTGSIYTATTVNGQLQEVKTLANAAIALAKRTVTIGHADLTEAANGVTQAINIGTALPANAVVLATEVNVATVFSGGSASACKLDIGGTDIDAIAAQMDIFTGAATGALTPTPAGVHTTGKFSSEQLVATFDVDVGHALLGLDAGELTITVWYSVLA